MLALQRTFHVSGRTTEITVMAVEGASPPGTVTCVAVTRPRVSAT
jgi:hypothetical protein